MVVAINGTQSGKSVSSCCREWKRESRALSNCNMHPYMHNIWRNTFAILSYNYPRFGMYAEYVWPTNRSIEVKFLPIFVRQLLHGESFWENAFWIALFFTLTLAYSALNILKHTHTHTHTHMKREIHTNWYVITCHKIPKYMQKLSSKISQISLPNRD